LSFPRLVDAGRPARDGGPAPRHGLPDANHGPFVIAGTLIDNEGVRVKPADPYPPNADNGGKPEYLVPDPRRQIQIDGVFGVNP
jgi:hypothetical protein